MTLFDTRIEFGTVFLLVVCAFCVGFFVGDYTPAAENTVQIGGWLEVPSPDPAYECWAHSTRSPPICTPKKGK